MSFSKPTFEVRNLKDFFLFLFFFFAKVCSNDALGFRVETSWCYFSPKKLNMGFSYFVTEQNFNVDVDKLGY